MSEDAFTIAGHTLRSRLLLGTGKFASHAQMAAAVTASGCELVTVALKRVDVRDQADDLLRHLALPGVRLLPNTSGARTAAEAVFAAQLAREALGTPWVKLEIHPDPRHLMPDPIETLAAAEILVREGFIVLPYVHADPVLCKRLEEVGCPAVMPLAAPIGTNAGLEARRFLELIIAAARVPVIVDAGLGQPSHACAALELGAAGVLVNTAIAVASDPAAMARCFADAVDCGRRAHRAGIPAPAVPGLATSPSEALLDGIL
jgi:thiazole synthase